MRSVIQRLWPCPAFLCLFFLPLLATTQRARAQALPSISAAPATPRITAPIDESNLARLPGNRRFIAAAATDLGPVPDALPQEHILMTLKRSDEQEQALEQLMEEQYNPQSPNFHKWLTPAQFGQLFGPSTQDIQRITGWLSRRGFTVNRVAPGRTFIDFSGTAGKVRQTFHTQIHHYRVRGEDHFANASDPMIPKALATVVSGFRALDNFHPQPVVRNPSPARLDRKTGKWSRFASNHASSGKRFSVDPTSSNVTATSGGDSFYLVGPQDLARIYGIKQVWKQNVRTSSGQQSLVGTGQTIGVIGDTDLLAADIQSFRDQFGISALGPNGSVTIDHPPASVCPAPDPSFNDLEGYVDAEWAGATAPDATVDFVACGDSSVTAGVDLAATYIVEDPAHAAEDAVLSSSYGYCEQQSEDQASQFYVQLWQQAAAEGITVVVASGDSGGAECDEFGSDAYADHGFGVNAAASTPYNIAAGGTDFSDTFSGTSAEYWRAANRSGLESAKSYIPEMTWNDNCASPLVLQAYDRAFGQNFDSSSGPDGLCTYLSQQPADPNTGFQPYFFLFAGSGGLSSFSARPAWQTGVAGIPAGNARALPDISMFAASGYTWGHALLFCDSAIQNCDFSNPDNIVASTAGGTSFVAPAFSGIMALIDQESGTRQGQANNILYPLAGSQYIDSNRRNQPSLANCAAYLGTGVLSSCYFHDVSGTPNPDLATKGQTPFLTGTTSVPCTGTATTPGVYTDASTDPASNSENCYGYQITVTQNGGSLTTTPNYYGILSTAANANSPAFPATPGYDLATGLGTPNVAALIDAPQWASGAVRTTVSLAPQDSTITPAQTLRLTATVTAQTGGTDVLGGTVTFFSANNPLGQATLSCGGQGIATLNVTGAAFGPPGIYSDVYAVYSGGTARCGPDTTDYFGATSTAVTVNVTLAAATITASPLYPVTQCCFFNQPYPLVVTVTGGAGAAPTGSVQIQFNGQPAGSGVLQPNSTTSSSATVLIDPNTLAAGNNALSLLYPGDGNYLPASGAATAVIRDPSVPFGTVRIDTTSTIDVDYTFVQAGTITLNFNPEGTTGDDFSQGNGGTCHSGARERAGTLCTIAIAFRPSQPGIRNGVVAVTFSAQGAGSTTLDLFPNGAGGAAQISLSTMTQVTLNSSLNQPQGLAFNPTGTSLYVTNSGAAQIVTLPPAGGTFTPFSTGGLSLVYPTDLTLDAFGNLLVEDGGFALFQNGTPGRVLEFTPAGGAQTLSTGTISLSLPAAIREDGGGNVYIADAGLAQLIEVPTQGAAPSVVQRSGLNLSFPEGMALDNAQQNLYIADGDTNQILELPLNSSGSAVPVNIGPCAPAIANCSLNAPSGVAFDLNGDMFVVDAGNFRVLMVPSTHAAEGTPTTLVPMTGLLNPSNIALDGAGNVYVPDVASGSLYKLVVASGTVNFGGQAGGSIPVTVTNTGNENLTITRLTFAQGRNSRFSETDNCARTAIAPGGECTINIRNGSSGAAEDVLTISSNAVATATIAVSAGSSSAAVRPIRSAAARPLRR